MNEDAHFDEIQHKRDCKEAQEEAAAERGCGAAMQADREWLRRNYAGIRVLYSDWLKEVTDAYESVSGLPHEDPDDIPYHPVQELLERGERALKYKGDQT